MHSDSGISLKQHSLQANYPHSTDVYAPLYNVKASVSEAFTDQMAIENIDVNHLFVFFALFKEHKIGIL